MQGEIPISQLKPVRATQVFELVKYGPTLLSATPTSLAVDRFGDGVEHTVGVRTDREATMLEVVAGISDHEQRSLG
jgi:hypothetical protein